MSSADAVIGFECDKEIAFRLKTAKFCLTSSYFIGLEQANNVSRGKDYLESLFYIRHVPLYVFLTESKAVVNPEIMILNTLPTEEFVIKNNFKCKVVKNEIQIPEQSYYFFVCPTHCAFSSFVETKYEPMNDELIIPDRTAMIEPVDKAVNELVEENQPVNGLEENQPVNRLQNADPLMTGLENTDRPVKNPLMNGMDIDLYDVISMFPEIDFYSDFPSVDEVDSILEDIKKDAYIV